MGQGCSPATADTNFGARLGACAVAPTPPASMAAAKSMAALCPQERLRRAASRRGLKIRFPEHVDATDNSAKGTMKAERAHGLAII